MFSALFVTQSQCASKGQRGAMYTLDVAIHGVDVGAYSKPVDTGT
jgi:hypothetical protein